MKSFIKKALKKFDGTGRVTRIYGPFAIALMEGLISRDGDAGFKDFFGRLKKSTEEIFPVAESAWNDGVYADLTRAFTVLCENTLDDNIVDSDFPIVRTGGYFKNSYPQVRMLCAMAAFFAEESGSENFLQGMAKADSKNHYIRTALSHAFSHNGNYRQAADEALEAQRLAPYDNCVAKRVNDTQRELAKQGLPTDFALPNADKKQLFCKLPFTLHQFVRGSGKHSRIAAGLCHCSEWTSLAFEHDSTWNSEDMQAFRASILDGSFKYCDEIRCQRLNQGLLPLRTQVVDPYLRSIIDNNMLCLEKGPENLVLSYDMFCNLRCPSCRSEWSSPSPEDLAKLDQAVESTLVPLLPHVKQLSLSNAGEALASAHSRRLLQTLSPSNYPDLKVTLLSNLSIISKQTWEQLGDSALCIKKIMASIDGSTPATLEKLRLGLKWERMLDAMNFLRDLRKKGMIEALAVSFVLQRDNYKELGGVLNLASTYLADELHIIPIVGHGIYTQEEFQDINICDRRHHLYADCRAMIEEIKKTHSRMLQDKEMIVASGRSVPLLLWRQA